MFDKALFDQIVFDGSIVIVYQKDLQTKANIFYIAPTILISPEDEAEVTSPVTLKWKIPSDSLNRKIVFQLQIDKTSNAFEDLEIEKFSFRDSGFEYWNGSEWVEYPAEGVGPAYYGNEVRITVALSTGKKYWRVRAGA